MYLLFQSDRTCICFVSEKAYIKSIQKVNVTTTAPTPAVSGADLEPKREDETAVHKPVKEALGCLMWLTRTRPDISLALNKVQKIAHSPPTGCARR